MQSRLGICGSVLPSQTKPFQHHTQTISEQAPKLPSQTPPLTLYALPPSLMATSISTSGIRGLSSGFWTVGGDDRSLALPKTSLRAPRPRRSSPMMGNVNEGKGVFAPLVVVTRNIVGKKRFNQLRGKAIALHSQVITEFCKTIGADVKLRQGLIRLAKKNGEKLGFLA